MISQAEEGLARSFSCGICTTDCSQGTLSPHSSVTVAVGASDYLGDIQLNNCSINCSQNGCGTTVLGPSSGLSSSYWTPTSSTYYSMSVAHGGYALTIQGTSAGAGSETWHAQDDAGAAKLCWSAGTGSVTVTPAPNHLDVVVDNMGFPSACPTTGVYVREMQMQVADSSNNAITNSVSVQEAFSNQSTNTCGNGQPIPSSCAPVDASGKFIDDMSVSGNFCNSGIQQSSGCGFSLTSTWSACGGSGSNSLWISPRVTHSNGVTVDGRSSPTQWPPSSQCTTTGCH